MEFEKEKYFSNAEYEYFMQLISEVNPSTYKKLKACEMLTSRPCIEKYIDKDPRFSNALLNVLPASEQAQGCQILLLDPKLLNYDEGFQRMLFSLDPHYLLEMASLAIERRTHVLQVIKSIDLQLYEEIIAVDPNGLDHIKILYKEGYGFGFSFSEEDGLPIFIIEESALKWRLEEQRFCLGRELGRYVLGHFYDIAKYEKLISVLANDKMTMRQLHFKGMFEDIFNLTSSFWSVRIQYFNELHCLIGKLKNKAQPKKEINWKEIAKGYLKLYEELDERKYQVSHP